MYFEAKPPKLDTHVSYCSYKVRALQHILDLIKDDRGWLVDSVEPDSSCENSGQEHPLIIGSWQPEDIMILDAIGGVFLWSLGGNLLGLSCRMVRRERNLLRNWNRAVVNCCIRYYYAARR